MNKLESYVGFVFDEFENTKAAKETREEILNNLKAETAELISRGVSEEESYETSIKNFGNIEYVRAEMSGILVKRTNFTKLVLIIAAVVFMIGILTRLSLGYGNMVVGCSYTPDMALFIIANVFLCFALYHYLLISCRGSRKLLAFLASIFFVDFTGGLWFMASADFGGVKNGKVIITFVCGILLAAAVRILYLKSIDKDNHIDRE